MHVFSNCLSAYRFAIAFFTTRPCSLKISDFLGQKVQLLVQKVQLLVQNHYFTQKQFCLKAIRQQSEQNLLKSVHLAGHKTYNQFTFPRFSISVRYLIVKYSFKLSPFATETHGKCNCNWSIAITALSCCIYWMNCGARNPILISVIFKVSSSVYIYCN